MKIERWKFSREFKLEEMKSVRDRGMSVSQPGRDLDSHKNVLGNWVREQAGRSGVGVTGHGVMDPERQEIERLRREFARMKVEQDLVKER